MNIRTLSSSSRNKSLKQIHFPNQRSESREKSSGINEREYVAVNDNPIAHPNKLLHTALNGNISTSTPPPKRPNPARPPKIKRQQIGRRNTGRASNGTTALGTQW